MLIAARVIEDMSICTFRTRDYCDFIFLSWLQGLKLAFNNIVYPNILQYIELQIMLLWQA